MPPANATGLLFHVYATPGNHEVSISGGLKSINLGANPVSAAKLQSIDQWGNITWTNMKNAFEGAENMVYNASDTPDLSGVTDMRLMFYNATSFNGDVSSWNVSSVDDMTDMFKGATSFMQNLGVWYVVPADTAYDATTNTLNVTTISAQNSALNGHSPNYAIGTGGNSTLFNMTGSTLMFKATPSAGDYTVNVTAPEGNFGTNNHHILGITVAGSANSPPTVNAGQDQEVAEGATVTLSGTANDDDLDDTLTYLWTHDGSLAITFADPAALLTTFTAPNVAANTTVTVTLTVNDGTVDISDTLQVNITDSPNNPPEVEAGDDQEVAEGATVTLSGTANDDDLDDTLTYLWTHDGSLAITFADPAALLTTFTAPNVAANTTVTVTLTVNDGTDSDTDTMILTILDVTTDNIRPTVDAGPNQTVKEGGSGKRSSVLPPAIDLNTLASRGVDMPPHLADTTIGSQSYQQAIGPVSGATLSEPMQPVLASDLTFPLVINGNGYALHSSADTVIPTIVTAGLPVTIQVTAYNPTPISYFAIYLHLQGDQISHLQSDAQVIWDSGEVRTVDPGGLMHDVTMTVSEDPGNPAMKIATLTVTFSESMGETNMVIRTWNPGGQLTEVQVFGALVVTAPEPGTVDPEPTTPPVLIDPEPTTPPVLIDPEPTANPDSAGRSLLAIRMWSGFEPESITDAQLLAPLGLDYPGMDIPGWVMTELGSLVAKGDVTVGQFKMALAYVLDNT